MSIETSLFVWRSSKQKGNLLLLLLAIAEFADKYQGQARPSVETLAKRIRLSERQTQRLLQQLVDVGELEITHLARGRGRVSLYILKGYVPPVKGDIAVSPFCDEEKVTSAAGKGDIFDGKGDIFDGKGDIAVSPDPPILDPISDPIRRSPLSPFPADAGGGGVSLPQRTERTEGLSPDQERAAAMLRSLGVMAAKNLAVAFPFEHLLAHAVAFESESKTNHAIGAGVLVARIRSDEAPPELTRDYFHMPGTFWDRWARDEDRLTALERSDWYPDGTDIVIGGVEDDDVLLLGGGATIVPPPDAEPAAMPAATRLDAPLAPLAPPSVPLPPAQGGGATVAPPPSVLPQHAAEVKVTRYAASLATGGGGRRRAASMLHETEAYRGM